VAPQERVQLYDVLRCFCLFGVLWSNLNDWYIVADPSTSLDHGLRWIQDWLVEERFYTMLGFLFGIGFAIQLTRAAYRGQDVRNLFLRRMAVLLAFGIAHATLIWHGDILTAYAVPFRRLSPRKLVIAAIAVWFLVPYLVSHIPAALNIHLPLYDARWRQVNQQALWAYAHGTWPQAVAYGASQFSAWLVRYVFYGASSFLALFILGLWAVRVDLVTRLTHRRIYILWSLLAALVCWGGFQYLQLHMPHWWPATQLNPVANWRQIRFWWPPRGIVFRSVDHFTTWASSAVYALMFAGALSFPAGAKCLEPLATLGRMTLTTYLTQSVICTALFYNWGLGLMNKTNLSGILAVAVVLFSLQIGFSVWWLKRYRFGPAEWVWRSVTYGKRLPNRISAALSASTATT
jgi:uncharacterized protein